MSTSEALPASTHPDLALARSQLGSAFINSPSEVVDDTDEDIEGRIINNFFIYLKNH